MFEYNYNPKTYSLFIQLPQKLRFNYTFHNDVTGLLGKCIGSRDNIHTLYISCNEDADYDKMSKAYLLNVFRFLLCYIKDVKWNKFLSQKIISTVSQQSGAKFREIILSDEITKSNLTYYVFNKDNDVQKPVDEITKLLVEQNLSLNEETIREFLSTTIGEIFSNSINHSHQDEIFFMFDIHYEKGDFYLCVNVIDYGRTIIANVKDFLHNDDKGNAACMHWAIQPGNTTRHGSGGYGLPMLISYIKEMKGILYILSDSVIYQLDGDSEYIRSAQGVFCGTSITFKVKLYNTNTIINYDTENEKLTSISLDSI